jgi:hypothetical protein
MSRNGLDEVLVVIPLFARPLRASLATHHEIRSEQLLVLASKLQGHLQELVPIVDTLKRSGWEILSSETSLICRHLSVRTKTQAEVALSLLGVDFGWYSVCDPLDLEQPSPKLSESDDPRAAP